MSERRRLRALAAGVAAALALAAAVLVTSERDDATPTSGAGRASETRCLPTGGLDTVPELDEFASTVRGNPEFQGGDVGASTELQDGRYLFVFGDTLRGEDFDGQQFVRNSMLVFTDACAAAVLPADHGALIPDRPDGVGYWPMSVSLVEHEGYDTVGVAAQRVRTNSASAGDVLAFDILGPSVAIFHVPRGGTPQLVDVTDVGPDLVDPTRPIWGAAAAVADDWVYLYGTARPDADGIFGFSLQVARVHLDDVLDQTGWRYWDGGRWSAEATDAVELIPAQGGVSQTLSVFEQDGRWYALSKRDEVLGTDLTVWTAPGPAGPFTASPTLAEIPSDASSGTLRYMPLAHPELLPEPGTVVVSYSENNSDPAVVQDDPRRYRPRFLRVDLPR